MLESWKMYLSIVFEIRGFCLPVKGKGKGKGKGLQK